MANFLVTYHGSELDPAARTNAREACTLWSTKAGTALTHRGSHVRSIVTISQEGTQPVATDDSMVGWSVIEAIDAEEAAFIMRDHPFIARGGILRIHQPAWS